MLVRQGRIPSERRTHDRSGVWLRADGTTGEDLGPTELDIGVNGMYIRGIGGVGTAPVFA